MDGVQFLLLETMKMEIRVIVPLAGPVSLSLMAVSDLVDRGQTLAVMEPIANG